MATVSIHPMRQTGWSYAEDIRLNTRKRFQFADLTDRVDSIVKASGIQNGLVTVQSLHTTCGVFINEHEPQLLRDMRRVLERTAPSNRKYRHDDLTIRTANLVEHEEANGHAHCKAMFLPTSLTVNVMGGSMRLGRWQRLFFVELDRPKARTLSVQVLGFQ